MIYERLFKLPGHFCFLCCSWWRQAKNLHWGDQCLTCPGLREAWPVPSNRVWASWDLSGHASGSRQIRIYWLRRISSEFEVVPPPGHYSHSQIVSTEKIIIKVFKDRVGIWKHLKSKTGLKMSSTVGIRKLDLFEFWMVHFVLFWNGVVVPTIWKLDIFRIDHFIYKEKLCLHTHQFRLATILNGLDFKWSGP